MALWILLLCSLIQAQRAPVPESAEQKEKEKLVRDVFKSDFAKKAPAERIALAKKLLQQGIETRDDAGAQYIMLREARDLAAAAGDAAVAVQAVGELARLFEVDALRMKLGVLITVAQETRLTDGAKIAAEALLRLADEADAVDDAETAEKAATVAVATARKAKDVPLAVRAEARLRDSGEQKSRQVRIKAAREVLAANPADPAANSEVGQFECFIRGNWEAGLPLLAKGSNEELKLLALKDLSNPDQMQEQIGLGGAWRERAEKEAGNKQKIRERAVTWYEKAQPGASGLLKLKIERALAALGGRDSAAVARGRDVSPEGLVGWWKLDEGTGTVAEDASGHRLQGKLSGTTEWVPGHLGKAVRLGGRDGQVIVSDSPLLRLTGDLSISLWFRKDEQQADWARLVGKGDHLSRNFGLFSGGKAQQGLLMFQQWDASKRELIALEGKSRIETGKWYHVAVIARGDDVSLYVEGHLDASGKRSGLPATSADPLTFGYAGYHQPFPGAVDDVRIYQRPLTEGEIQILYGLK